MPRLPETDFFTGMAGPPSASKDNPVFPRKQMSMSEKVWGLRYSMLPLRYTHPGTRARWCMPGPDDEPESFAQTPVPFGGTVHGPVPCQPPLPGIEGSQGDSRFRCFPWFVGQNKEPIKKVVKKVEPPTHSLEIPQSDPYAGRYPYRYSSAGPCFTGATKKEAGIRRCRGVLQPSKEVLHSASKIEYRDIIENCGYETTQMQQQLRPLQLREAKQQERVKKPNKLRRGMLKTTQVKWTANDPFCQFITDELRPNWTKDPATKKKMLFRSKLMSEDVREWDDHWHMPARYKKPKSQPKSVKFSSRAG